MISLIDYKKNGQLNYYLESLFVTVVSVATIEHCICGSLRNSGVLRKKYPDERLMH